MCLVCSYPKFTKTFAIFLIFNYLYFIEFTLIYNHMETKLKELYDAPSMMIVEVKQEGVICASPGQAGVQDYYWNNPGEE